MAIQLGSAYGKVEIDISGLKRSVTEATGSLKGLDQQAGASSGGLAKFGGMAKIAVVAGVGAMVDVLKESIQSAMEAQRIMAQTEAVIKSTGSAAGFTAPQIQKMAESFVDVSTYSDDAIQSMQNVLLTFPALKGDVFKEATQAVLDMSTALGTDLQGAAIQVGKALQDPVKGVTALRRVGVNFSADQVAVIKSLVDTGKAAEAQQLILKELATEFGGSAAAAADTMAGKLAHATNAIDNMKEAIGNGLLPMLGDAADGFTLLFTGAQKLDDLMVGHEEGVRKTAATYKDYEVEIERSGKLTGNLSKAQNDVTLAGIRAAISAGTANGQYVLLNDTIYKVNGNLKVMTEAEFAVRGETDRAIIATRNWTAAQAESALQVDKLAAAQEIYAGNVGASIGNAVAYTAEEKKLAEMQRELADLDRKIAGQGPAYTAAQDNKKMSDIERAAAQAKLAQAVEDASKVQRKAGDSDADYAVKVAEANTKVADLTETLGTHTVTLGGTTKAQNEQRTSLQNQIDEFQKATGIKRATEAFDSLNKAYKSGGFTAEQYIERMTMLNSISGLYSETALKTAISQQVLLQALSDPTSVEDWRSMLNDMASDLGGTRAVDPNAIAPTVAELQKQANANPVVVPLTVDPESIAQGSTAAAVRYELGKPIVASLTVNPESIAQGSAADKARQDLSKPIVVPFKPDPESISVPLKVDTSQLAPGNPADLARQALAKPIVAPFTVDASHMAQGGAEEAQKQALAQPIKVPIVPDITNLISPMAAINERLKKEAPVVVPIDADTKAFNALVLSIQTSINTLTGPLGLPQIGLAGTDAATKVKEGTGAAIVDMLSSGNTAMMAMKVFHDVMTGNINTASAVAGTSVDTLHLKANELVKKAYDIVFNIIVRGSFPNPQGSSTNVPGGSSGLPQPGSGNQRALGGPVSEGWWFLHDNEFVLSRAMRLGQQPIPPQALPAAGKASSPGIVYNRAGDTNIFQDALSTKMWMERQRQERIQSTLDAM